MDVIIEFKFIGLIQRFHDLFHKIAEYSSRFDDYFTNKHQIILRENENVQDNSSEE
jgi:hypothetical protein